MCFHYFKIVKDYSVRYNFGCWGLTLYKSFTRPQIEYCAMLYYTPADTEQKKLTVLQKRALRICLGVMKTSPIKSLLAEADVKDLGERRQLVADKYFLY